MEDVELDMEEAGGRGGITLHGLLSTSQMSVK